MRLKLIRIDQQHETEPARIVVGDARTTLQMQHHMVVRRVLASAVIDGGPSDWLRTINAEGSRHAEMHEEHRSGIDLGEKVFGAAAERGDAPALQPGGESLRERKAQIR